MDRNRMILSGLRKLYKEIDDPRFWLDDEYRKGIEIKARKVRELI